MSKSRIWEAETAALNATKLYMLGAIHDIITRANFDDDRLRGFGVATGTSLLHFLRLHYNVLALSSFIL